MNSGPRVWSMLESASAFYKSETTCLCSGFADERCSTASRCGCTTWTTTHLLVLLVVVSSQSRLAAAGDEPLEHAPNSFVLGATCGVSLYA